MSERASIFSQTGAEGLSGLLNRYAAFDTFNIEAVRRAAVGWLAVHDRKPYLEADVAPVNVLLDRWYSTLQSGAPDFSVYGDPFYVADIWTCWVRYSRNYLRSLHGAFLKDRMPLRLSEIKRVVDLGCGFGYTTAGLKEIFPNAAVTGTNLAGTTQFRVAEQVGWEYGFDLQGESHLPAQVDLVFASEFYEHLPDPFSHLLSMLAVCRPRLFVVASSFQPKAIGHYNRYQYRGKVFDAGATSRFFGSALRASGYRTLPTSFWNNRPTVWVLDQYRDVR